MLTRRDLIAAGSAIAGVTAAAPLIARIAAPPAFVRREGMRLMLGSRPYRYAGTNMWYAAYLGADAPYGNRERLKRELDRVAALGLTSIRIVGSSDLSPLKN